MIFDPAWFDIFADWCINLSAGWFGAALIVPVSGEDEPINWPVALSNVVTALALLLLAFILRTRILL